MAGERDPFLLGDLAAALYLEGQRDRAIQTAQEAVGLLVDTPTGPETERLRETLEGDLERYRQ